MTENPRLVCFLAFSISFQLLVGCVSAEFNFEDDSDSNSDTDEDSDSNSSSDGDTDIDTDIDSDSDVDSDTDTDTDSDSDADSDVDTGTQYQDQDSDGWISGIDCDDKNPNANQGEQEIYNPPNGVDEDCDGLTDEEPTNPNQIPLGDSKIAGVVKSASGFPISGALVYLTTANGTQIPDNAYCQECDEVIIGRWTTSNADGTWAINTAPEGTMNIVTRKGNFQRQRQITVIDTGNVQQIPDEVTTLPGANSLDGLDQIPNFAVLLNHYDRAEDMLAKMGLGELDTEGHLVPGTEEFDAYQDQEDISSSVGPSSYLFDAQANLDHYHMVFFPCICGALDVNTAKVDMLTQWIAKGGKMYSSCWASQWPEQTFPDVINFNGSDGGTLPGDVDCYDNLGTIRDDEMRAWLNVVSPVENVDNFPFVGSCIAIQSYSTNSYDGNGLIVNDDGTWTIGGPVTPYIWVDDNTEFTGKPMTLTYNYECGKVFYSTYQVVESRPSPDIRPQEWVLIYLFYEVGVCEGEVEEVPPPT